MISAANINRGNYSSPTQAKYAKMSAAEEVARTVVFLASPASGFMTGAIVDVNGGRFLRG